LPVIGNIHLAVSAAIFGLFSFLLLSRIFNNKFSQRGTVTQVADRMEKIVFDLKKNRNGRDRAMVVVTKQDTYGPAFTPLSAWREILTRWQQQNNYPIKDLLSDFDTILNLSAEVIRVMPYSPDLMWRNGDEEKRPLNEEYRESFDYFF